MRSSRINNVILDLSHAKWDSPTPVTILPHFSSKWGLELRSKRDDLFPLFGGGSKARMLHYILHDMDANNTDVLVTAGGPNSNFNRACALACAEKGVPMHLVEYTEHEDEFRTSCNYHLCKLVGIRTTRCAKTEVAQTVSNVIHQYEKQGLRVRNIYGGGRCVQGFYAYYEAVKELRQAQIDIDELFIACGTGTTLTGVCAGMQKWYPTAIVHGISVARTGVQERPILEEDMRQLNDYLHSSYNFDNLHFNDHFLCGGYALYSPASAAMVKECISKEGMIIDPTYSGKAFYGMSEIIKNAPSHYLGKKVLFWNTGGIFNLLSSSL